MGNITPALEKTLSFEGLYSNDPVDPGGETYRGIARKYHPGWYGWTVIDRQAALSGFPGNLNEVKNELVGPVTQFYSDNFFMPLKLDQIASQDIVNELFDTAVNAGMGRAGKMLQTVLNFMNKNGQLYPDLETDGNVGPATINAVNIALSQNFGEVTMLKALAGEQYIVYRESCTKDPAREKFFYGWLRRV